MVRESFFAFLLGRSLKYDDVLEEGFFWGCSEGIGGILGVTAPYLLATDPKEQAEASSDDT